MVCTRKSCTIFVLYECTSSTYDRRILRQGNRYRGTVRVQYCTSTYHQVVIHIDVRFFTRFGLPLHRALTQLRKNKSEERGGGGCYCTQDCWCFSRHTPVTTVSIFTESRARRKGGSLWTASRAAARPPRAPRPWISESASVSKRISDATVVVLF